MNQSQRNELMHAVIDEEASPEQELELERLLATDAGFRTQFEALRRLQATLGRVTAVQPPEGLVDLIMARIPPRPVPLQGRDRPLWRSRVIAVSSVGARDASPGILAKVHRVSRSIQTIGTLTVSEHKNGFLKSTKGRFLVGAGVAAAAVLAVSSLIDVPLGSKDTVGTIVPAQRYRAPQNAADDIKVTQPSGTQSSQVNPEIGNAAGIVQGRTNTQIQGRTDAQIQRRSEAQIQGRTEAKIRGSTK